MLARPRFRIRPLPGWEPAKIEGLPIGHYELLEGARDPDPEGFMDRRDLLGYGPPFLDLIDFPPVFDLIVDIMGPNILLSMTQAIVRPSTDAFPDTSIPMAVRPCARFGFPRPAGRWR